jgi:L-seryl-tRNA(Ser) seleniumtransferase
VPSDLRRLPSVDRLLQHPDIHAAGAAYSRPIVLDAIQQTMANTRMGMASGAECPPLDELAEMVAESAAQMAQPSLRRVINATGIIIHTNLGRAPLPAEAIAAMAEVGAGYSNLEYDLPAGKRGSRFSHLEQLIREVTGAEAGLAVNNNAAALLLCLTALAKGKEVIVSRGQAVEIGGGFRIPDVLRQSGARLVEVGTTNRTYADDYAAAITSRTGLILQVHTSNFKVVGFTHTPALAELVQLGRAHGVPVVDDLGSGTLLDTADYGLPHEPMVQESVAAGSTLVCFSGDKLLGGPQSGLIVGQEAVVRRLLRHPLARAVRLDKATIAGLAATLLLYRKREASAKAPVWQMIGARPEELKRRAEIWATALRERGASVSVQPSLSTTGGGSLPEETLPTWLLAIASNHPNRIAARLRRPASRNGLLPVVARVEKDLVLLDPRTILTGEDEPLLAALMAALEV